MASHAEDNRGLVLGDLLYLAESSAIGTLSLAENINGLTLEDESSTEGVEMAGLLEIEVGSIELLNDVQLTDLLKRLLNLEARSARIAQRAVDVALNINVPDGGEDGRIEWYGDPQSTNYLPHHLVQF